MVLEAATEGELECLNVRHRNKGHVMNAQEAEELIVTDLEHAGRRLIDAASEYMDLLKVMDSVCDCHLTDDERIAELLDLLMMSV
jgi:hypothetical protein